MRRLLDVVEAHQPVGVLVGLPLGLEGEETPNTEAVREVAGRLRPLLSVPLEFWDERMTTARALRAIREQGGSVRGRREDVDALSAAVLLQHYIDSRAAHG
jgi:putative Holliday junction resolvase